MGGTTSRQIAIRHPELVNRLVLASTTYKRDGMQPGFATTPEPNGNAAISTSCSDCNSRQTDWTRSLVLQTQPGRTSCLCHTNACYESDRCGSCVGSRLLVEAAGKPRLGRSLALKILCE